MKILRFIKSPAGSLCVFVIFAAMGGVMIHRSNAREKARASQMTVAESAEVPTGRQSILRAGQLLKIPPPNSRKSVGPGDTPPTAVSEKGHVPESAPSRRAQRPVADNKPRVLPISLFFSPQDEAPELSKTYAPFGRLIPCETVVTLESSKLETPVIGLVTDDVWHEGRLVIPAGTEVHGRAALDRSRERISASGQWVVVWRDDSPLNGAELVLNGIALDRQRDDTSGEFGLRDGSAGLVGQLLKSDDWQEIKLFASTFLAGFASGLQELQNQGTAFGGVAQVPVASSRTAALQGTADVLNAYARQIQETIARDGFFVRVPAGKQFYLYVTETIDQAKGIRGNRALADIWKGKHEN